MTTSIQSTRSRWVAGLAATLAFAAMAFAGAAQARDNISLSLGIATPGLSVGISNGYQPRYYEPRAVYVQPAPIYVQPRPIYYGPQTYYQAQPNYYKGKRHHNKFRGKGHGGRHDDRRGGWR